MKRKNITKHFTYAEMTRTDTGLPNEATASANIHLVYLCRALERVREKLGVPLIINSAYRSPAVNEAVGGAKHSYHLDGRACDISTSNMNDSQRDKLLDLLYDESPNEIIVHSAYIHFAI